MYFRLTYSLLEPTSVSHSSNRNASALCFLTRLWIRFWHAWMTSDARCRRQSLCHFPQSSDGRLHCQQHAWTHQANKKMGFGITLIQHSFPDQFQLYQHCKKRNSKRKRLCFYLNRNGRCRHGGKGKIWDYMCMMMCQIMLDGKIRVFQLHHWIYRCISVSP